MISLVIVIYVNDERNGVEQAQFFENLPRLIQPKEDSAIAHVMISQKREDSEKCHLNHKRNIVQSC